MSLSVRARLTLLYTAVLSVVLAGFAAAFYLIHARSRVSRLDEELSRAGAVVAGLMSVELEEEPDLPAAAQEALRDLSMPGRVLAVFDGAGTLIAGQWPELPVPGPVETGAGGATARTPAGRSASTGRGPGRTSPTRWAWRSRLSPCSGTWTCCGGRCSAPSP